MTEKPDGGSAYPLQEQMQETADGEMWLSPGHPGMSLRDFFAGQAIIALVTEALRLDHKAWDATAEHAYFVADAMIAAREADK